MATPRDSAFLRFHYNTRPGRFLLRLIASRPVSRLCGAFLNTRASKPLCRRFVRKNHIDLRDYYADDFRCFNDCFSRKIREGRRPIDPDPAALIAPCDGLLTVYPVTEDTVFPVKQSRYTVTDLLGGDPAAQRFFGGQCLVFRLCVNHYHRYVYIDGGEKGENVFLPGQLHTVRPIALRTYPVFIRNCREYTLMHTDHFGCVAQIEVGALLVGKIKNLHGAGSVARGEEKGMFLYGGSTIILLLEPDRAAVAQEILDATARGEETPVRLGQRIGVACGAPLTAPRQEKQALPV